jgi:hypothetical protein
MKRFFLYVLLPGVVLGMVYQMGRNSGIHSLDGPVSHPVVGDRQSPPVVEQPVAVAKQSSGTPDRALPDPKPLAVRQSPPAVVAKPVTSPERSLETVVKSQLQPPKVVVTRQVSKPVIPVENVASASGRSVYDRRDKPSSLGLMPLAPLSSSERAAVYPGSSRQPVFAPVFPPVDQSAPAVRSLSPVRITSSAECDCGKQH